MTFSFYYANYLFNMDKTEKIAREELNNLATKFYISRTGVEFLDDRKQNPLANGKDLPPIFAKTYGNNRKTMEEYDLLDKQLADARNSSNSMFEFRSQCEKLHYANCTTLACFLCDSLTTKNVDARVFSLGGDHHCVIARGESPNQLLVIDPWAGMLFNVTLPNPINDLEQLSVDERLLIAKKHFKKTNLYPDYKERLDELFSLHPTIPVWQKNKLSKDFFEIQKVDRFMNFTEWSAFKIHDSTNQTNSILNATPKNKENQQKIKAANDQKIDVTTEQPRTHRKSK